MNRPLKRLVFVAKQKSHHFSRLRLLKFRDKKRLEIFPASLFIYSVVLQVISVDPSEELLFRLGKLQGRLLC